MADHIGKGPEVMKGIRHQSTLVPPQVTEAELLERLGLKLEEDLEAMQVGVESIE